MKKSKKTQLDLALELLEKVRVAWHSEDELLEVGIEKLLPEINALLSARDAKKEVSP